MGGRSKGRRREKGNEGRRREENAHIALHTLNTHSHAHVAGRQGSMMHRSWISK
jgi:hypothetical protein